VLRSDIVQTCLKRRNKQALEEKKDKGIRGRTPRGLGLEVARKDTKVNPCQAVKLVLSLNVLGNPMGLFRSVKRGVVDAIVEPVRSSCYQPLVLCYLAVSRCTSGVSRRGASEGNLVTGLRKGFRLGLGLGLG